jgi:hypothetical protein
MLRCVGLLPAVFGHGRSSRRRPFAGVRQADFPISRSTPEFDRSRRSVALSEPQGTCCSARSIDLNQVADNRRVIGRYLSGTTREDVMIRPTVVALALCVVSSAQCMPYAPLQQPNNSVIQVRQGCGLGRQLVDGICVRNSAVRAAVSRCSSRKMWMLNGRCESRARPANASGAAQPAAQQPAATSVEPR